jgi:hypothetical protein
VALRGDGDEEEFPALQYMVGRSVDEDYWHIAIDPRGRQCGPPGTTTPTVDLAGPFELSAPKEDKADEDDSWSFRPSSDGGDDLDFSAFDSWRT